VPNSCLDLLALASLRLRIACFFAVVIANSQFFSLPNYKFGRTGDKEQFGKIFKLNLDE